MREMSVQEAGQDFSKLIAAVERGETIKITKNGTPVATHFTGASRSGERSAWANHEDDKYGG